MKALPRNLHWLCDTVCALQRITYKLRLVTYMYNALNVGMLDYMYITDF